MAIEKLKEGVCNIGTLFMKTNEIIDYLNSQETTSGVVFHSKEFPQIMSFTGEQEPKTLRDDLKGLAFRDAEVDQIIDVVKKHQGVEQEPNKVELVPLDVDPLAERIAVQAVDYKNTIGYDIAMFRKNIIPEISKYGVPTQKKWTEDDVFNWLDPDGSDVIGDGIILKKICRFLKDHNLLEE